MNEQVNDEQIVSRYIKTPALRVRLNRWNRKANPIS
jgi:hypothetical protein